MNHAAEGLLQSYLDGEATGQEAAEIEGHMVGCDDCRSELEHMRARSLVVATALQRLDLPAAESASQQAWWRVQAGARKPAKRPGARFAASALARAAAILLVFAGALAALPGSPLRKLLTRLLTDEAPPATVTAAPRPTPAPPRAVAPAPTAPARRAELPGVALVPANGRVRVLVWSALHGATIRVNLIDGTRVSVEAGSDAEDVRFRTANGRIEVMNLGSAEAEIQIPRDLPFASLDVDGRQWLFKDGDQLHLNGPVVEQARNMVVFRVK